MLARRPFLLALATTLMAQAKKREAPDPVTPVTVDGMRYEVVHFGKSRGLPQNGGYIAAVDTASGKEVWVAKVYDVVRSGELEGDKQDVFIIRMQAGQGGRTLMVENERGNHFIVDLTTRLSRPE